MFKKYDTSPGITESSSWEIVLKMWNQQFIKSTTIVKEEFLNYSTVPSALFRLNGSANKKDTFGFTLWFPLILTEDFAQISAKKVLNSNDFQDLI